MLAPAAAGVAAVAAGRVTRQTHQCQAQLLPTGLWKKPPTTAVEIGKETHRDYKAGECPYKGTEVHLNTHNLWHKVSALQTCWKMTKEQ